jgi:isopropylmalate/homocitrate/citramalate synthase
MEGTTVNGRGVRKGRWAASAGTAGVVIAMDCERNAEWWANLSLTLEELKAMVQWVEDCRGMAMAEDAELPRGEEIPF